MPVQAGAGGHQEFRRDLAVVLDDGFHDRLHPLRRRHRPAVQFQPITEALGHVRIFPFAQGEAAHGLGQGLGLWPVRPRLLALLFLQQGRQGDPEQVSLPGGTQRQAVTYPLRQQLTLVATGHGIQPGDSFQQRQAVGQTGITAE